MNIMIIDHKLSMKSMLLKSQWSLRWKEVAKQHNKKMTSNYVINAARINKLNSIKPY